MTKDSIAALDHLSIKKAHFVGESMGGMFAQVGAARFSKRTLNLTSIMSTPE
jgi:pimeloyl-ACP methyl ester carboxylesterase